MKKNKLLLVCFLVLSTCIYGQYDQQLVELKSSTLNGNTYSVVKMSRKGQRLKVKYFASKSSDGTTVQERYTNWARNKNIVAYSSGTYMTTCYASNSLPVGICVDGGNVINEQNTDKFDGLAIVYATGGMVASNIKDGNLKVTAGGRDQTLDIRVSMDKSRFMDWAKNEGATVFQTHLFVYKNQITIGGNSSTTAAPRRFLSVCRGEDNELYHYIINLPANTSILEGSKRAVNYLQRIESIQEIVFLINLDTGCQNIFQTFLPDGRPNANTSFKGDVSLNNAINLIVYYYE